MTISTGEIQTGYSDSFKEFCPDRERCFKVPLFRENRFFQERGFRGSHMTVARVPIFFRQDNILYILLSLPKVYHEHKKKTQSIDGRAFF
jgi:hypothetical protein